MGACTACRAAKVKCDQVFPCGRCLRLHKECVPHVSRQGQYNHAKRRRTTPDANDDDDDDDRTSEDVVIASRMIENPAVTKDHYGLLHLVRQWIALALKRRTWKLWARAGNLALQCGMSMDDILCEMNGRRGMDCLYPFLLTPGADQTVVGAPLQVSEVPSSLWSSIGITDCDNEQAVQAALQGRWVFIRETNRGISRFYVSPGFEQNVASRDLIQETYRTNEKDIADLYLTPECGTSDDFLRGFTQQIGLHSRPGMITKPTRLPNVRIKTKGDSDQESIIQEVDQLWCLAIPHIDQSFGLTEFVTKNHWNVPEDGGFLDSLMLETLDLGDDNDDLGLIHELFLKAVDD